jgi:hypothetical protein
MPEFFRPAIFRFFLSFILAQNVYALDTGDGSDGVCVWNNTTIVGSLYQCESLEIIGTVNFTANEVVFIKVQNDVLIDGVIDLSGSGRDPGPGGFLGGQGSTLSSGQDGQAPAGLLTARGRGGSASSDDFSGFEDCFGAGGSGGRHSEASVVVAGQAFNNVSPDCNPQNPSGGAAPNGFYGDPLNFHDVIRGGAGGGAGGSGMDSSDTFSGGDGGGGGGALKLYNGGDVTLTANALIDARGADGENTPDGGGAGGGGAGGAIFISSLGEITIDLGASLTAVGGAGGSSVDGGDGSDGGAGFIRLEDNDGVIDGANDASDPAPSIGLNPISANPTDPGPGPSPSPTPTPSPSVQELQLSSSIGTGCALRLESVESYKQAHWSIVCMLVLLILLGRIPVLIKTKIE